MTARWRLAVAYDGAGFSGWAVQPGLRTVQGVLEEWIPQVLRLSAPVSLVCAGRTDAGVHARGQVCHLDVHDGLEPEVLRHRLSRVLPTDVVVGDVRVAPEGFDARFSAIWRRYAYRICDTTAPDPLLRGHVVRVRGPLDVEAMNRAGAMLVGLRDFAPFCKRREGATTIRTLTELHAERRPEGTIEFTVRADAFCHSMVRSLMGAMTEIGRGHRDEAWLAEVMAHGARHPSIPVMAPEGLCLEEVGYPADDELAARAAQARNMRAEGELE
ncbi:tRNA pseudouridine(38-40) synthase TruA [Mariniluteicoccus endophyticus]